MKKRYARILAATLSAAMVFTSAPASVFDTGVIEAKATLNHVYNSAANDELSKALSAALDGAAEEGLLTPAYSSSTTATQHANAVATACSTTAGKSYSIEGDDDGDVTVTAVVAERGTEHCCGEYSVTFTATNGSTSAVTATEERTLTIVPGTGKTAYTKQEYVSMVENYSYTSKFNGADGTTLETVQRALTAGKANVKATNLTANAITSANKDNKPGTFSATATVTPDSDEVAPAEETFNLATPINVTVNSIVVSAGDVTATKLAASAEYKYIKDATTLPTTDAFTSFKDENGATFTGGSVTSVGETAEVLQITQDGATWNATADSRAALLAAVPTKEGTVVPVKFFLVGAQPDKFDYSAVGMVENGFVYNTINVKVVKGDLHYDTDEPGKTTVPAVPTATFKVGDSEVKLTGATKDKYMIVRQPSDLSKIVQGTTTVTIETVDSFSDDIYNVTTATTGFLANSTINGSKSWSYNKSTGKLSVDITISTVTKKTLKASDIVFPEKLANGATITVGDVVSDLKLEETASKAYGTFKLVKTGGTTAGPEDTEYKCVFTPNTDVVQGLQTVSDTPGVDYVAGSPATYTKKFAVTVNRKTVKSADIVARTTALKESYIYGYTYDEIKAVILGTVGTYDATQTSGTWTVKEGGSKVIPMGTNTMTLVYTLKDSKTQAIDGDKASVEIPVKLVIDKPVYEVKLPTSKNVKVNGGAATVSATPGWKDTETTPHNNGLNVAEISISESTWYSRKTNAMVYGSRKTDGTIASLNVDDSIMTNETFYCVVKYKVNDTLSAEKKAAWAQVIGDGTLQSNDCKVTVTNMTLPPSIGAPTGTLEYGKIDATVSVQVTSVGTDYELDSIKWQCISEDGKTVVDMESKIAGAMISTATIPTTLDAGKYTVAATITATSSKYPVDVAVVESAAKFTIDKTEMKKSDFDFSKITFDKDAKIIKYGTKLSEIKFNPAKDAEKYGSYEYINDVVLPVGTEATHAEKFLMFIPKEEVKKNYKNWDTIGSDIVNIDGITVEKGEIVIKANDITVNVGDKVSATDVTTTVTGLVGTDTLKILGINLSYDVAAVDTTKAGTCADALVVKATAGGKTNDAIALLNYKVKVVPGNVIVKAAAPVVTPTPAPVKQAVAAAPKAAKAKATVKVGKKYTLKLKYAAGKKSTVKKVKWTSSKKSVATVSSKGKVTAKKAGKATIYARVYFKDGSMKKIKFTVTVK